MNKALHVLVYVFLALARVALFFEIQLNAKRAELRDRNRMQEDYLVKIAKTIEKAEADKSATFEVQKDASAVEAKLVDIPDMANLLDDYPAPLEQANLETYNWDPLNVREQLRSVYVLDPEGKPVLDMGEPMQNGSPEQKLLEQLFQSCTDQQARLNSTRAALTELRGKLESVVNELNKLKPEARQDKVSIVEQKEKIAKLEGEKAELEGQITKLKSQIDDLNAEITSLKDEVQQAKDDTDAAKEEIAKGQKVIEQLKKLLHESLLNAGSRGERGTITSLPAGNKGKLIEVDNENMFAIVEFSDAALKELKGDDLRTPVPQLEFGLRRTGFNGPAGEFVGRIRLRQEVKGKNYVICDILGAWEQASAEVGDLVFAD